jgi:hypothetical protein
MKRLGIASGVQPRHLGLSLVELPATMVLRDIEKPK